MTGLSGLIGDDWRKSLTVWGGLIILLAQLLPWWCMEADLCSPQVAVAGEHVVTLVGGILGALGLRRAPKKAVDKAVADLKAALQLPPDEK